MRSSVAAHASNFAPPLTSLVCPPAPLVRLPKPAAGRDELLSNDANAILLCRYPAGVQPRTTLQAPSAVRHYVGNAAVVRSLVSAVNSLPEFPNGNFNCPGRAGDTVLMLVRSQRHGIEAVTVEMFGCRTATNGLAVRWGLSGGLRVRHVFALLEALSRAA